MKQQLLGAFCVAICVVVPGQSARADSRFRARCDDDHMPPGQQVGRNEWAYKCGYVKRAAADFNNADGNYVTFLEGVAPLDGGAPCFDGWHVVGWCAAEGCYTPTQRLMFGSNGYQPIGQAAMSQIDTVSGFADHWLPGDELALVDEKINVFTVGDQFDGVLEITTNTGKQLQVTDTHPMVSAEGQVMKATQVIAGSTELLTVDGPEQVASVRSLPYVGQVWNIEPQSTRQRANLHVAEGFVTGSVRYQNEWLDDAHRRSLRDDVDLTDF